MTAYIDFYTGQSTGFKQARAISKRYEEYPVIAWRILFTEILDQLCEFDGVTTGLEDFQIDQEDEDMKAKNYKKSKAIEPQFSVSLESKEIQMEYTNVDRVFVKYYVIDHEVLFSRTPFLMNNTSEFSYTKPIKQWEIKLDTETNTRVEPINADFVNKNMVIEVQAVGKSHYLTYTSASLKVAILENYGELKVTDQEGNPLSQVYVKAFARYNNGQDKFFKDGYTDIRGKFEYAQTNSNQVKNIQKFGILIKDDSLGSLTKEVKPPSNTQNDNTDSDLGNLKPQQLMAYR